MKTRNAVATVLALLAMAMAHSASAASFTFTQAGFSEGGLVTGTFSGTDRNNDGRLFYEFSTPNGEIDGFMLFFSGNSAVQSFSLGFADLGRLQYDLGSPILGDGFEGIDAFRSPFFYVTGQGELGIDGGQVSDGPGARDESLTLLPVRVIQVPDGGATFPLLGFALAATFAASKRLKQLRLV